MIQLRPFIVRAVSCSILLISAMQLATSATIAQQVESGSGSGSKTLKAEAIRSIPFERLNEQTRTRLMPVLERPSIYRRLPTVAINSDSDYLRYLVRYPEVVVEIWKLMGVTKMDSTRTGSWVVDTNDGAGTLSQLELVYGDETKHIFYATGTYEGPLLRKKLSGRCVLVLTTEHGVDLSGSPNAVNQLDVFLKVDNAAAGVIARTLQPIVGPTADHNFRESIRFIERLYKTTLRNGPGVQSMGERLTLKPEVLRGFQDVAGEAYRRGLKTQVSVPQQISLDQGEQRFHRR